MRAYCALKRAVLQVGERDVVGGGQVLHLFLRGHFVGAQLAAPLEVAPGLVGGLGGLRDGRIHLGALELRQDLAFAHHVAGIDAHLLDEAADLEAEPDLVARREGADGAGLLRDRGARDRFGPHGCGRRGLRRGRRVGLRPAAAPCQGQRQGGHERQPTGNDAHRKGSCGDRRDVPIAIFEFGEPREVLGADAGDVELRVGVGATGVDEFGLVDLAEVALAARDLEGAAGRLARAWPRCRASPRRLRTARAPAAPRGSPAGRRGRAFTRSCSVSARASSSAARSAPPRKAFQRSTSDAST